MDSEGTDTVQAEATDEMFRAFWASKSRKFREKWAIRLKNGLSPKRKFQLTRQMAEFFARQGGLMEDVAKAKRDEYQQKLERCEKDIGRCQEALYNLQASREQLKGAVEAMNRLLTGTHPSKDPGAKTSHLQLVPKPEDEMKLNLSEPLPVVPAPAPEVTSETPKEPA